MRGLASLAPGTGRNKSRNYLHELAFTGL